MKRTAREFTRFTAGCEEPPKIENRVEFVTRKDELGMPLAALSTTMKTAKRRSGRAKDLVSAAIDYDQNRVAKKPPVSGGTKKPNDLSVFRRPEIVRRKTSARRSNCRFRGVAGWRRSLIYDG
jgi:hypothetical protein